MALPPDDRPEVPDYHEMYTNIDMFRRWVYENMPAFLKAKFPDMCLLTIVKREGGDYVRQGWVSVPFDATLITRDQENGFAVAPATRESPYISVYPWESRSERWLLCERYGVKLVSCGHLAVAGMFDPEAGHGRPNRFDQVMRRVTLALDGHVCWPDWDDTIMEPVHEGTLVPLVPPMPISGGGDRVRRHHRIMDLMRDGKMAFDPASQSIVYRDEAPNLFLTFDENPKPSKSQKRKPGGTGSSPAASMTKALLKKLGLAPKRDTV